VAIINPWLNRKNGYYYVNFDNKHNSLHRLVAEQFIPNPDNLSEIDHCDRCRTNNSLSNLRWVSRTLNTCNKTSFKSVKYEYLDELPEGYEVFNEYQMRSGRKRFFNNLFIKWTNEGPTFLTNDSARHYRFLHQAIHNGSNYVQHQDIDGKHCSIWFNRISKTQDGINTTQQQINQTQQGINLTQQSINTTQQELIKVLNKLTDILEQTHPEEYSEEEYEHYEPEEDYKK
jgi:hypothetical protein